MIEVKQALLDIEINRVKEFLSLHDLTLDNDCDTVLYLEENDKVIGTISKANYVIKNVAVDPSYQGSDLTGMLVNKIVEKMDEENIHSYLLFTKPKYEMVFKSLGFNKLAQSKDSIMFEKGTENIDTILDNMKALIQNNFLLKLDESIDIGCCVINANPFTLGHQYLVEEISKRHDYCVVFLVSEDKSIVTYTERLALAYLSTRRFNNVLIIPSSRYCVSLATFPTYFIHSIDGQSTNAAELDAKIFRDYFMKKLFIKKRYVGSETKDYMKLYNSTLHSVLGDNLVELERIEAEGVVVSASNVRKLLESGKTEEALQYIPNESKLVFRGLINEKYSK